MLVHPPAIAGTEGTRHHHADRRYCSDHDSCDAKPGHAPPKFSLFRLLEEQVDLGRTWASALGRWPLDKSHNATISGVRAAPKAGKK